MRTVVEERGNGVAVMDVFSKMAQKRALFINEPIDDEIANEIICQMLFLNSEDNTTPIDIYINSPGGSIIQGLAIYDVAKKISAPINTICVGMAASMGAILMLMGETRKGFKHSRFLFHQSRGGAVGTYSHAEVMIEEWKVLQDFIYDIIIEKTNVGSTEITELLKEDWWFGSDKALELGLLTEII